MKVLLVNPPKYLGKIPVVREDRCEITDRYAVIPPYSLIWIASILRNMEHSVKLINANGLNMKYDELRKNIEIEEFDVLIFRFTPTTFGWDMKTAEICKEVNSTAKIVGLCLTLHSLQREVMKRAKYMNIYIAKEWETVIPDLINSLENGERLHNVNGICFKQNGQIIVNPPARPLKDYNSLPIPAYDLLPNLKVYRPNTPVSGNYMILYASKGCSFNCIFCTVAKTPFKIKSGKKIIGELKLLFSKYNVRLVSFFDETFTINRKRVIKICEEIKNEMPDLRWYCNTRADLVDPKLLKMMYEGGCRGIAYGIESGSQKILDNAKKGIKVGEAKSAIKWIKEAGIKVYTSVIFGLPGENWDTVRETIKFVKETLPHGAQFNVAVPYPGTELYARAIKEGFISKDIKWDELYQHKARIRTKELSPEELEKIRRKAYRSLYFNPRWLTHNIFWVFRRPGDFTLGIIYYLKILRNFVVYRMEHAH